MKIRCIFSALSYCAAVFVAGLSVQAQANVIIHGTRLVYPAQKSEITIQAHNPDNLPALVQLWADEGDPAVRAQDSRAPFVITPPLIRIEPGSGQAFRVLYVPGDVSLPQDRESLFYFNLLDIPPKAQAENGELASYMQFAYRSRLKLFYRPEGLPGTPFGAAANLDWRLASEHGKPVLQLHNPSAYHVSFHAIELVLDERRYPVAGDMIAPGASVMLPIEGLVALPASQAISVEFGWINDYGARVNQRSPVSP